MAKTDAQWLDSYEKYSREYDKQKKAFNKKGYDMASSKMGLTQFRVTYTAYLNDKKADIEKGVIKSLGNPYPAFVSHFKYETTESQAKAIQQAVKDIRNADGSLKFGVIGIERIMANAGDAKRATEFLKREYEAQKAAGMKGAQAKIFIAQTYFGSE